MPFLTIGDPDLDTSIQLICELEAAGADIVELGVPYSDPLADGPVIQRASERALAHGITLLDCIAIARQAREKGVKMPFVLFSYYNPVLQLGLDRLIEEARQADISGMIIPDLPYEEDGPVRDALAQAGLSSHSPRRPDIQGTDPSNRFPCSRIYLLCFIAWSDRRSRTF